MTLSFAGESRSSADGRAGRVAVGLVFYGSLLVVLVAVLVELLPHLIPVGLANRIGHNSEAYLLTVLLALWIQLIRPRVSADRRAVCITATAAVVCIAVALVLLASDWPSRFRTLNETFLAAMLLIPYVQLSRRPSRRGALAISLGLLCVVAALGTTALVTSLAETLGVLILAPIAFDVVDRGILDEERTTSTPLRLSWYITLVLLPLMFSLLHYRVGLQGVPAEITRYSVRVTEAFLCLLLVELYFAVFLGRTGRPVFGPSRVTPSAT